MTKICPSSKKCIKSIKKFLRKNDENKKTDPALLYGADSGLLRVLQYFR